MLIRIATTPNVDDRAVLDPLLETESWQTLITFARESARTSHSPITLTCISPPSTIVLFCSGAHSYLFFLFTAPQRPTQPAPDGPSARILDDDIPPELFDSVAAPGRVDASGSAGGRVCPHCTFENAHGGNDCEVCGLPL